MIPSTLDHLSALQISLLLRCEALPKAKLWKGDLEELAQKLRAVKQFPESEMLFQIAQEIRDVINLVAAISWKIASDESGEQK